MGYVLALLWLLWTGSLAWPTIFMHFLVSFVGFTSYISNPHVSSSIQGIYRAVNYFVSNIMINPKCPKLRIWLTSKDASSKRPHTSSSLAWAWVNVALTLVPGWPLISLGLGNLFALHNPHNSRITHYSRMEKREIYKFYILYIIYILSSNGN